MVLIQEQGGLCIGQEGRQLAILAWCLLGLYILHAAEDKLLQLAHQLTLLVHKFRNDPSGTILSRAVAPDFLSSLVA